MAVVLEISTILIFMLGTAQGLYEDQINKYDWKKEYIGKIHGVTYDSSLSASKNLYVTTDQNVVASLVSKNGELNWRQICGEKVEKILHYPDGILTIESDGMVRVWDSATGLLKWDANLMSEVKDEQEPFKFLDVAVMELTYTEGNLIAVLSSTGLFTVRIQSSPKVKTKVKYIATRGMTSTENRLFVDSESKQILVLTIDKGSSIFVTFYDAKTLETTNEHEIQAAWLDSTKNVVIMEDNLLIYASEEMEALYIIDMQHGVEVSNEPLSAIELHNTVTSMHGSNDKDMINLGEDFWAVLENGEVVQMRINDKNTIVVIGRIPASTNSKFFSLDAKKVGSVRYFFVVTTEGQYVKVTAWDQTTGKEDESLRSDYQLPADVGKVDSVFINMYLKRTSPVGYRLLLTTSDDSVLMVTLPTRLSWRRDEALANVVTAEMLDLPLSDMEAGIEVEFEQAEKLSIVEMFANRINAQIGQVRSFAKHLTKGIKEGTLFEKKTKDPLIQDESLTRDPFSLHKMLVLVTKCGKLFGMDSLTGEIIWHLYSTEMQDKNLKLYIQRTTAHFPNPPQALLLGTTDCDSLAPSMLTFNPITGEVVKNNALEGVNNIIQVMLLPFTDSTHLRPLLLLDENLDVHLIPDTEDVRDRLKEVRKSVYLFDVDKKSGKISGYWLQKGFKMIETFIMQIPAEQEVVLVRGKDFFENIDAMGRPLADRSVIYKYLNPNLVLIITASKDSSDPSSSITMYLIDGVSGDIVYYATHKKASGPVHAVHSENWVVYSYWNTKFRRTEIASYELYEGKQLRNGTSFTSLENLPGVPTVFSQAYLLGATVNAMGVSKTERALTSRQILIGLGRGAVLGLPRRLFDPRRPLTPAKTDREEGLIPYLPEIQVIPAMLINYNKTIHGITSIYSCPSALESTSIVLVTGLDIFFTRTQPSKMFDVLKEDFEYLLITAVLLGMFIAAVVTRKLAQNKKLNKAWR